MKRRIFWSVFFTVFLDCRSANLLRLFSGNLPAMFLVLADVLLDKLNRTKIVLYILISQIFYCLFIEIIFDQCCIDMALSEIDSKSFLEPNSAFQMQSCHMFFIFC